MQSFVSHAQSLRDVMYYYSMGPDKSDGVNAMRYQKYKAHFFTEGWVQRNYVFMLNNCTFPSLYDYQFLNDISII